MDLQIKTLKESNIFLNDLYDNMTSAIFIADRGPRIYHFNNTFKTLFYKPEDRLLMQLCGNAMGCIFHVEESKDCGTTTRCADCLLRRNIMRSFADKVPVYKEKLVRDFVIDDSVITKCFSFTTRHILFQEKDMILVILDDITEQEEQKVKIERNDRDLENSIRHTMSSLINIGGNISAECHNNNEILKKIHHSIGNNLQIVLSLIRLQMRHVDNGLVSGRYQDIENRILTIRLLYNHLVQLGTVSYVNMKNYLNSLIMKTCRASVAGNPDVTVEFSCDDIYFNIDTAMPVGLITYEIVSNSMRHAFRAGKRGTIKIILGDNQDGSYLLFISDDGRGFDKTDEKENKKKLGITLVHILAEQIGANITTSAENGTSYNLQFAVKKINSINSK